MLSSRSWGRSGVQYGERPTGGLTLADRLSVCQFLRDQMNKNVERGQATRAHLIEVATRLFATHGYDGTSIETVLAESGVSRGSLYHHFQSKDALFLAVLEGVGARIGLEVAEEARDAADPLAALAGTGRAEHPGRDQSRPRLRRRYGPDRSRPRGRVRPHRAGHRQ